MTGFAGKICVQGKYLLNRFLNQSMNLIDPPIVVLVYHRVTSLQSDPEMLAVTPENFRKQMQHLKDTVPILRFEEDWQAAAKPAIVVTFDDGYADNFLEALPILEEVGVPATFFVSTGTIGTKQEFWWHELEHIILEGCNLPGDFTMSDDPTGRRWPTASDSDRREFYHEMVQLLNEAETGLRDTWLAQVRLWAGCTAGIADVHRVLTVEELQLLSASAWATIGAHTVSHARLSSQAAPAQREEIVGSKRQLESWLGQEVIVFSYPFGNRCDYTEETVTICRQAGFAKAAGGDCGQAHRWTDPYQIPRQLVRDWPIDIFVQKLKKFWRS